MAKPDDILSSLGDKKHEDVFLGKVDGRAYRELKDHLTRKRDEEIAKILEHMNIEDRRLAIQILQDMMDSGATATSAFSQIWEIDYKWKPVTIEQFIEDEYYLGRYTTTMFPVWRDLVYEIFAPGSKVQEVLLGGAIGIGKTWVAAVALVFIAYRLSCLRNPAKYYQLANGSTIVLGMYSLTMAQANDVGYDRVREMIEGCPYFEEKFDFNRRLLSSIRFNEQKLHVRVGSKMFHSIGVDLFGYCMDEASFFQQPSQRAKAVDPGARGEAEKLYDSVINRMQSRFMRPGGMVPGISFLMSSKQDETAFLERRRRDAIDTGRVASGECIVREYARWEVKNDPRLYTKPKFYVEVGDQMNPSRILEASTQADAEAESRDGAKVIEVPGEFKASFVSDTDRALRDIAGVATFGMAPLFRDRTRIKECETDAWEHPFTREEITLSDRDDTVMEEYFDHKKVFKIENSRYVPRLDPHMPRFAHIDMGLNNDSLGLAIGHVHGIKHIKRSNPNDGMTYNDRQLIIYIDMMIRINPPSKGEIDWGKVRAFLIMLRDSGLPLTRVTTDGSYGRDTCQIMRKLRFESETVSVDRDEDAYITLRQAIYSNRIWYYPYQRLTKELVHLERDVNVGKVDHPAKFSDGTPGGKDVADAVAAVCYTLTNFADAIRGVGGSEIVLPNDAVPVSNVLHPPTIQGRTQISWDQFRQVR
jgi:hypothetical protein